VIEFRAFTARVGAYTQICLAASPEIRLTDNGSYYVPVAKKQDPSALAQDGKLARRLWEWSEMQLKEKGFE
jgi:hypothetical protein